MRFVSIILLLLSLASCDGRLSIDEDAALRWSKKQASQSRRTAEVYSFQRDDGLWVSIATARHTETISGLLYEGAEILKVGYITYPGGRRVETIEEAILIGSKAKGANYTSEPSR